MINGAQTVKVVFLCFFSFRFVKNKNISHLQLLWKSCWVWIDHDSFVISLRRICPKTSYMGKSSRKTKNIGGVPALESILTSVLTKSQFDVVWLFLAGEIINYSFQISIFKWLVIAHQVYRFYNSEYEHIRLVWIKKLSRPTEEFPVLGWWGYQLFIANIVEDFNHWPKRE